MRLRFAPSPTGALHIGGARTALFNWLLARGHGGQLLLRIEDTDRERSTQENVRQILDSLEWLGIDWDEGPILQSERAERHAEALEQLLERGHAYRSAATAQDVRAYKERHGAQAGFRAEPEERGAVRLHVPDSGTTVVHDIIRGQTTFAHQHLDDPVIARADGTPLYNFAVAVDDADARISHVVRGEDHLSNTPRQLLVLQALGVPAPTYAHLPLLHGPDGRKLSKRHGAASVAELRDGGYLPEAVRNYIALLGWGYDETTTFFTTEELQREFALQRVSRSPATFDEPKLRWMNGRYLRELAPPELVKRLEEFTGHSELAPAVLISAEKIQTLADFWPLAGFIYQGPTDDPAARARWLGPEGRQRLATARDALGSVAEWAPAPLERALRDVVERLGVKSRDVFQPVRVALAGTTVSPGLFETLGVLGRDEALRRIDTALAAAA